MEERILPLGTNPRLYTIGKYNYHKPPTTKLIEGGGVSMSVTTWMYDDDQKYFNFEAQYPIEQVKDDFNWEAGGTFPGKSEFDFIEDITAIVLKDGLLVIGGRKTKGNGTE